MPQESCRQRWALTGPRQQPDPPLAIPSTLHQDDPVDGVSHEPLRAEVEVIDAPTVRYTQDNQTPIAEMQVRFDRFGRAISPVNSGGGMGKLAQELQNRVQVGQR